jgi:BRCA1-associated protein
LVLFELCTEEAAEMFVEDLHGKPYTFLDETVTCSVYHVAALQGEDGVSLMSPFFAPSKNQSLELLPSHASDNSSTSSTTKRITAPTSSNTPSNTSSVLDGATTTSGTHTTNSKFSSSRAEDYNCAVCLEHMDLDRPIITPTANYQAEDALASPRTSILTTVCNHTFHLDCLLQWQDSPCPVCRYDHSGLNETLSQCHVCGTTENNYVCLICGLVSCGGRGTIGATSITADNPNSMSSHANRQFDVASRLPSHDDDDDNDDQTDCRSRHKNNPDRIMDVSTSSTSSSQQNRRPLARGSHAWDHYEKTLHAYALNTETQHVWDFAGQGYVHRLLQNKEDGKLVEVNDPRNTTSHERSTSPGLTEAQEGEVVHRKLEGFASQYYTLLKSQLEQQRIFYQGRLEEIRREYSDTYNNKQRRPQSTDLISALKHEKHQLNHRLNSLQSKCRKVKDDVAFLKSMNESLEVNRETVRCQIEHAQRDRVKARKMFEDCLPPLQEKVTRLMLQLENHDSNTIEDKPAAV